jgi:hypothetical protein
MWKKPDGQDDQHLSLASRLSESSSGWFRRRGEFNNNGTPVVLWFSVSRAGHSTQAMFDRMCNSRSLQMSDIRKAAFGDAVTASFADLIQIALLEAKRRGLYVAATSGEVKRLFARKILQAIEAGERDTGKLQEIMLGSLGMRTRLSSSQS